MHNNYFTLFEIEPSFHIDLHTLESKYIELSRKFHPDLNNGKIHEMLDIHKAYKVLQSPLRRAEHILNLFNVETNADTEILQESMEIREYLLNCDDFQSVTKLVNNKINDCMKSLSNAFSSRNLNNAATQVIRLKYLYKTSEEIKNQRK